MDQAELVALGSFAGGLPLVSLVAKPLLLYEQKLLAFIEKQ